MAYPPPVLPVNRTNALPQIDTHPADHNLANQAINDIVGKIGALEASLQGQINSITADLAGRGAYVQAWRTVDDNIAPGAPGTLTSVTLGAGEWAVFGVARCLLLGTTAVDIDITLDSATSGHQTGFNGVNGQEIAVPVYVRSVNAGSAALVAATYQTAVTLRPYSFLMAFRIR